MPALPSVRQCVSAERWMPFCGVRCAAPCVSEPRTGKHKPTHEKPSPLHFVKFAHGQWISVVAAVVEERKMEGADGGEACLSAGVGWLPDRGVCVLSLLHFTCLLHPANLGIISTNTVLLSSLYQKVNNSPHVVLHDKGT